MERVVENRPSEGVAPPPGRILYLTFDGVLEPLGRSQVLRYIERLSDRGYSYALLSLERDSDLADAEGVKALESELAAHSVRWVQLPYRRGGVRAMLENCRAAYAAARRIMASEQIDLIHARAHVPAAIAWKLHRATGVPYLFDMRGYWIHEKAAEGRWFTNRLVRDIACRGESRFLRGAGAVATLTESLADDLRAGVLAGSRIPVATVGTCADFDEFTPDADPAPVPPELRQKLTGKLVIAWIGSVNASYYFGESLRLFQIVRELRPDAHLLCLTRQVEEMERRLSSSGIAAADRTVCAVGHREMPAWLIFVHWGLLLVTPTFSKRGAMPTKLAEFLASGVRPIQYGCNDDVTQLVRDSGSGIVLDGISEDDLRKAAERIASMPLGSDEVLRAREIARPRVGLEHGVAVYQQLMESIFVQARQS